MKRFINRAIAIVLITFGIAASVHTAVNAAQTSSNADVTIVAAIAVSNTAALDFASIVPDTSARTVVMNPVGTITSCGAGVMACTGTPAAASFDVTGGNNLTYSIDINGGGANATLTGPGTAMTVGTWTSTPTPTGTLSGAGAQTVTVGGTLSVGGSQVAGAYTGTFTLDVLYN